MKIYAALACVLASSAVAAPHGGEDGYKDDHQKKVTVTDYKYKTEYVSVSPNRFKQSRG